MKLVHFIYVLLFLSTACTQDLIDNNSSSDKFCYKHCYTSFVDTNFIVTPDLIKEVAFSTLESQKYSRDKTLEISEIFSLIEDLAYVVNFDENNGFVIVSNSKDLPPVLAYSSTGTFKKDNTDKIYSFIAHEYKDMINNIDQLSDSEKLNNRILWSMFAAEHKDRPLVLSRDYSDVESLIQNTIFDWQQHMYNVYTLEDFQNTYEYQTLSYDDIQQLEFQAQNASWEFCDPSLVTFVITGTETQTNSVNPLLQSTWGQRNGYDQYTSPYPVGCVAVALGQIMRYHQYPLNYQWNLMPYNYPTSTTAQFLAEIGQRVRMNYGNNGSTASNSNAKNALTNYYGYPYSTLANFNVYSVISDISNHRPVYLYGSNSNNSAHAWVCDGYTSHIFTNFIRLMILPADPWGLSPEDKGFQCVWEKASNSGSQYLHMNWGWDGDYDGYFNTTYWQPGSFDFSNNKLMIYNIYHL